MGTTSTLLQALFALCLCLFTGLSLCAGEFKVAAIFADNMVLQRGIKAPVWGWGSPGADVTVEFAGQRQAAKVGADGKWTMSLAPLEASATGRPFRVSSGGQSIVRNNVLVGEVWLCSGQSNIQRNLHEADNAVETVAKTDFPTIRFMVTPKDQSAARLNDYKEPAGTWHPVEKADKDYWKVSAIAFFFARDLQQKLKVPVGLIVSAWEGTHIQTWIPPKGDRFNGKITPLIPLAVKGVIWYQGEEDHGMGLKYSDSLTGMVEAWRKDWGSDLPFLIVLLAPHPYQGLGDKFPGEKGCVPLLWMGQMDAVRKLTNAEVACTVDVGDVIDDIHPKQKEPVGARLAAAAMKICYGEKNSAPGPVFKAVNIKGQVATILFDNTAQGLKLKGDPSGFEIAGTDKKYAPAKAMLAGKDSVSVSSNAVAQPAYVRYAWSNTPASSVYNSEGLPALAFSTEWIAAHPTK